MSSVEAVEVAMVLRQAISGVLPVVRLSQTTWEDAYCGLVEFNIGGWLVTLYNDCGSLDYCDKAIRPTDGLGGWLDLWQANGVDPVELLTEAEQATLEKMLQVT